MTEHSKSSPPLPFDELAQAIKARRSVYGYISGLKLDRAAPGEAWSSLPYRPVFVGDTGTDMECAYNSGCIPVLLGNGATEDEFLRCEPRLVFPDGASLFRFVRGL